MPSSRIYHASAAIGGAGDAASATAIIVAGGRAHHADDSDGRARPSGGALLFDPYAHDGRWRAVAESMSAVRYSLSATSLSDGCAYAIGGMTELGFNPPLSCNVERYDPRTDHWQLLAPLPHGVGEHVCVATDGQTLMVLGGRNSLSDRALSIATFCLSYDSRAATGWQWERRVLPPPYRRWIQNHAAAVVL